MKYTVRAIAHQDIVIDATTPEDAEFLARESDDWEIYDFEVVEITLNTEHKEG